MKRLFYFLALFSLSFSHAKNTDIALSIKPLDHEALLHYNFSTAHYDEYQKAIEDSLRVFFSNYKEGLDIKVIQTFDQSLTPYYAFATKPALTDSTRHLIQKKLMSIDPLYTRFLPFTNAISITINGGSAKRGIPFTPVLEDPIKRRLRPYESADLKSRFNYLQKWLKTAAIPLLADILNENPEAIDLAFGSLEIDADRLLSLCGQTEVLSYGFVENYKHNPQLIATLKVMLLCTEGRFEYARTYSGMIYQFEKPGTLLRYILDQLVERLTYYNMEEKRIVQNARGLSDTRKAIYLDSFLEINPKSATLLYERLDQDKNPLVSTNNPNIMAIRNALLASDPITRMELEPLSKKDAYQNYILEKAYNMFIDAETFNDDFPIYAEMALELEAYEFACDLYWMLWMDSEMKITEYQTRHDYAFIKSVEPEEILPKNKKKFKRLDKKLRKKMKKNPAYKQFKY